MGTIIAFAAVLMLIPISLLCWFITCLNKYKSSSIEEKSLQMKWVILSGITAVVLGGGMTFLIVSFTLGIMFM